MPGLKVNSNSRRLSAVKTVPVLAAAFALSSAIVLHAADGYPNFSWDRVPVYAHVGLGKGLKPNEYRFLAEHYDFIAFTGGAIDREYRSNRKITFERIVTDAAGTIKQHNPNARVLFYLASDFAKPHNKLSKNFPMQASRPTVESPCAGTGRRRLRYSTRRSSRLGTGGPGWLPKPFMNMAATASSSMVRQRLHLAHFTSEDWEKAETRLWKKACSQCLLRRSERWAKIRSS